MASETTENDAEIARLLSEDFKFQRNSQKTLKTCSPTAPSKELKTDNVQQTCNKSSSTSEHAKRIQIDADCEMAFELQMKETIETCSPALSKKLKTDNVQQTCDNSSSTSKHGKRIQIAADGDLAFALQIQEIVLMENKINEKTTQVTDIQLEKIHTDMTKQLQPTEKADVVARTIGIFGAIQLRYASCQAKNQVLIDQIQQLSAQFYPMLISSILSGKLPASGTTASGMAIGLITNVLQKKIKLNDAKQIMYNLLQLWNDSTVWYEFFEQLVYILVALTLPSVFAQGAMGKVMEKISSSK